MPQLKPLFGEKKRENFEEKKLFLFLISADANPYFALFEENIARIAVQVTI